ncbi:unnamed protein product [Boreogadus saida]
MQPIYGGGGSRAPEDGALWQAGSRTSGAVMERGTPYTGLHPDASTSAICSPRTGPDLLPSPSLPHLKLYGPERGVTPGPPSPEALRP